MSNSIPSTHWILREPFQDQAEDVGFIPEKITAGSGRFGVQFSPIGGGKSMGMELLSVDTGAMRVMFLPDRGMGIWKCEASNTDFGWNSPVDGPVHPSLVPVLDPSGIGWLEGFDELFVRCGLQSNGAPDFDPQGNLKYPLHGRIANLPATKISVAVDVETGTMDVLATVREARFLVYSLELQCRYRLRVNSPVIEVTDTVTNLRSTPTTMQLLYHINLGQPIVQAGTTIEAAYKSLCPRDPRAAEGLESWSRCEGPTEGYAEQVYLMSAAADSASWSEAMLATEDHRRGYSVHFDTRTLPYLNIWKNTAAVEDGYVVGLEPATGFPNPRRFEEKQNRVVPLSGGESKTFRLKLQPLLGEAEVNQSIDRIRALQPENAAVHPAPLKDWSPA
ncbi:aldose 1-epimerase family protein [Pirellulaceae bacterium SH501]